jgi:tripartite-type tricarboxylate transporter receptor subunit TctC
MSNSIRAATARSRATSAVPPSSSRLGTRQSIEIVVLAGAGVASDQMARMMPAAIQTNNLMKAPVVLSLKGWASGAEALIYLKSNDGGQQGDGRLFPDLQCCHCRPKLH